MTNEEIIELIRAYPRRKTEYMEQLYNQNRGIIYKIAKKFENKADSEDLMQEAYIILDRAAESFDGSLGVKFVSFLSKSLVFEFSKYVFKKTSAVDMPYSLQNALRQYTSFKQEFYQAHGKEPTEKDIMRALSISKKELDNITIAAQSLNVTSIDKPADFDESITLADIIPSDENIAEYIEESDEELYRKRELYKAIDRLTPNEGAVIYRNRLKGESLEQIASDMGVSASYCGTLGKQGIRHLQRDWRLIKAIIHNKHYEDSDNYHYSVGRFRNSGFSSVEFTAIKNEELQRALKEYHNYHSGICTQPEGITTAI